MREKQREREGQRRREIERVSKRGREIERERLIEIYGEKRTIHRHKEIDSGSKSNDGKN